MILAALGWAATTVYIKRFFTQDCTPFQTLLYQLLFSIPVLFLLSFVLEKDPIRYIDVTIILSLFYQTDHRGFFELLGLVLSDPYLSGNRLVGLFFFHPHFRGVSEQPAVE